MCCSSSCSCRPVSRGCARFLMLSGWWCSLLMVSGSLRRCVGILSGSVAVDLRCQLVGRVSGVPMLHGSKRLKRPYTKGSAYLYDVSRDDSHVSGQDSGAAVPRRCDGSRVVFRKRENMKISELRFWVGWQIIPIQQLKLQNQLKNVKFNRVSAAILT